MKIATILGTRPEIIRLSEIIRKLDKSGCEHKVFYTGQNSNYHLSKIFFEEMGVREPDYWGSPAEKPFYKQIGEMFASLTKEIDAYRPDKVLVLGDTNSSLSAIMIERLGIPVYHMEAGNRCHDVRVPEEVNRRCIDHACSFNLPYTHRSMHNLLAEGIDPARIFVCGNPIFEVLNKYKVPMSIPKEKLCLMTIHRSENMALLQDILGAASSFNGTVTFPIHPKTKDNLRGFSAKNINIVDPVGFLDMMKLYNDASLIITDSGTVMEEACILKKKCIVVRASTERPEAIEAGGVIVSGRNPEDIKRAILYQENCNQSFDVPSEYVKHNVSQTVVNILLGGSK